MLAAMFAVGSTAVLAQDPCADTAGQTELDGIFRAKYASKDRAERKAAVEAGKQFLEKYGACEVTKDFSDYLKSYLPGMEDTIKKEEEAEKFQKLVNTFNAGLKSKNWNDVYSAGEQILAQEPDKFRQVELVLGSIGLDESAKTPRVTTWNDKTLRYAKQSIQDLESGKTFSAYGVNPFAYKNKEDALGWMNYTIGYITYYAQNNKKDAMQYFYKATQAASDTKKNPVVYETVGRYYYEEAGKLVEDIKKTAAEVNETDTQEVKDQKAAALKAKVAILNGTAERAIDAYARAYNLAKADATKKAYADALYKKIQDLYSVRFPDKTTGVDAFITAAVAKPMPDPTSAITPIEPDEVKPQASSAVEAPAAAKPAAATSAKVVTPVGSTGAASSSASPANAPKTVVKKPVVKKKATR
jgi:hypothetical protein